MSDRELDRTKSKKKLLTNYININFRQRSPVILALEDTSIYFL